METLVLNFAHPLTADQHEQLAALLDASFVVHDVAVHADRQRPLVDVARELAEGAALSAEAWQTTPLVVNPPGLAPLALALVAEIHGRSGAFPAICNVRPVPNTTPTRYEVAAIVNLQAVRDAARTQRT